MAKKENIVFYGTGRRKNAIARVRLVEGNGKITINGKDIDEFFGLETDRKSTRLNSSHNVISRMPSSA